MKKLSSILLTGLILTLSLSHAAAATQYYRVQTMPDGSTKTTKITQPLWKQVLTFPGRVANSVINTVSGQQSNVGPITQKDMQRSPTILQSVVQTTQNTTNKTLDTVAKVPGGKYVVSPVRYILKPVLSPSSNSPKPTPFPVSSSSH